MSKYVIFNKKIGNYLNPSGNTFLAVSPEKGALKFKSIVSASNYLIHFEENIRLNLIIRDMNGNDINQEMMDTLLNNEEEIYASALNFCTVIGNVSALLSTLNQELSQEDLATQDILHKIEFDYLMPDEKIDMINKLHNIRRKRRMIKDKIARLEVINKHKDSMMTIKQELNDLFKTQEERDYSPRVLKDLYDEV